MYQVNLYVPTNAFFYVAIICFGVIIVVRIVRWVLDILP